jgi:hypothetical protein
LNIKRRNWRKKKFGKGFAKRKLQTFENNFSDYFLVVEEEKICSFDTVSEDHLVKQYSKKKISFQLKSAKINCVQIS